MVATIIRCRAQKSHREETAAKPPAMFKHLRWGKMFLDADLWIPMLRAPESSDYLVRDKRVCNSFDLYQLPTRIQSHDHCSRLPSFALHNPCSNAANSFRLFILFYFVSSLS